MVLRCLTSRPQVLVCGNGGKRIGRHTSGHGISRSFCGRPAALPGHFADSQWRVHDRRFATIMAPDEIFAKAGVGLGEKGDVLIALTTSGKSKTFCARWKKPDVVVWKASVSWAATVDSPKACDA